MDVGSHADAGTYATGMTFTEPTRAGLTEMETRDQDNFPSARTATVWGMVESVGVPRGAKAPRSGVPVAGGHCALTVQNKCESFQSLTAEGYLDLHRALGMDGMVALTPDGPFSGELEIDSDAAFKVWGKKVDVRHKLCVRRPLWETTQSIIISLPAARLGGKARLTLRRDAGNGRLSRTTFEIGDRVGDLKTTESKISRKFKSQGRVSSLRIDTDNEMRIRACKTLCLDVMHKTNNRPSSLTATWNHGWNDQVQLRAKTTIRESHSTYSIHCRFRPGPKVNCSLTANLGSLGRVTSTCATVSLIQNEKSSEYKANNLVIKARSRYIAETGQFTQDLKVCQSDQFKAQVTLQSSRLWVRPRFIVKFFIPFLS